ncbi:class I SAM-dependent methyltransferase [Candidatus Gracilibacteria bacterium]|nr:class I SAM-dependent methyltransferase [Candidatus Gracilibacteria bacterium]
MSVKKDLAKIYDTNAKKYYETRKKHWEEVKLILDEIKKTDINKISILEFGCGGGRFISELNKTFPKNKIKYTGIDISKKLLEFAQKDNPKNKFIYGDISEKIKNFKQESFDFIIGTEAFQHIENNKERFFLMKNFYRILKYNGKLIITNRSFSNWFIKKYHKNILNSISKYIISFGKKSRKDIYISRKNKTKGDLIRFYHIFGLKELDNLTRLSGFVIDKLCYLERNNKESQKSKNSKTSILIASKKIFK